MTQIFRVQTQRGPEYAVKRASHFDLLSAAPWHGGKPTGRALQTSDARLLAPIEPSKIIGIGKNYKDHAKEMGGEVPKQPLLFLKPPNTVLASEGELELPTISQRVDYEAELGVVIGKRARKVTPDSALNHVFGYLALCDVTARDLQAADGQWARAKGCDGFCPVAPCVTVTQADPQQFDVRLWVNKELKQDGNTRDMVFSVAHLISHISEAMTLEPGDLIATGTPSGVGPLSEGDQVIVRVGGLPDLRFLVSAGM